MKRIALAAAILAVAPQVMTTLAWAVTPKKPPIVAENFPEDILQNSIGLYVTPRGQQILAKGVPLLRQNGMQISNDGIPEWDYAATSAIDIQNLPIEMSDDKTKTTLSDLQKSIKEKFGYFKPFNNPLIKLKVNDISYSAKIDTLSLLPSLEETQFLHQDNTIVVVAQVTASQLKLGVSSITLNDTANKLFNNGDIALKNLSIATAANTPSLTFSIPLSISLDPNGHVEIKALRVDNTLTSIETTWDFSKLTLPALELVDKNDKQAIKDGEDLTPTLSPSDPDIQKQLPNIAKTVSNYLANWVKENGVDKINQAFASAIDVNSLLQEVNTMSPPGAADGTTPVPYMWGLSPHTLSLTDSFLFTQIDSFVEDPLSSQHIALPTAARAKAAPDMTAVNPQTYDVALQIDEGFINRLLQLSYLRGYFNSITQAGGNPLKLTSAPTITADDSLLPNEVKMHVTLDYTNDPSGVSKLLEGLLIQNVLKITFDMTVYIVTDTKAGTVVLQEGPIDIDTAQVDPSAVKTSLFHGTIENKVKQGLQSALSKFNAGLTSAPATLTSPISIPNSIAGVPISLSSVQADKGGSFMIYLQYGAAQ